MPADPDNRTATESERSFRALLVLCVIAPIALFVALAWYDHDQIVDSARADVAATTRALAEHAEKVIETNRLVLDLMANRVHGMSWQAIHDDAQVHELLVQMTRAMAQLESVFYVSPDGLTAASSRAFPMKPYDVTMRDYFKAAVAGDTGLFISTPFAGQMAGTFAFTASRPIDRNNPTGGLVAVTLSPAYFERFYQAVVDPSLRATVALLRDDGVILVRYPAERSGVITSTGLSLLPPDLLKSQDHGLREGRAAHDHAVRIVGFQRIAGAPLVAAYGVSKREVLMPWYRHLAALALLCCVLAVSLVQATRLAMRRTSAERRSLRRLVVETTRREQAEEAVRHLQKIEALGRLTGGIAHDFNNLLTAILGSLELAQKRNTDPTIARLLTGAMEASARGARLTQHMLAFSRQQNLAMVPVDVNAVLAGMKELLERTIGPGIRMRYTLADGLWHAVADATQLEASVLNLVINARDAMPAGGDLELRTYNLAADAPRPGQVPGGDMVCLALRDSGTGMPPEVVQRAIEPFFTTKDVGHGTGLGLSTVHGFVRQAGGELAIESAVGRGTHVRLYFPRASAAVAPILEMPASAPAQQGMKILVLDDDLGVRTLTAEMIRELGHEVVETGDGRTALMAVRERPDVTLAVLDFAMPDMNGGEVARHLTQIRPDLPLVFVSGYAERSALSEWTARGYPLLGKPFTLQALAGAMADAMRRQAELRAEPSAGG